MAKAFERFADMTAVRSLTVPAGAHSAKVQALGGDVRYRNDGTNPAIDEGNLIDDNNAGGEPVLFVGPDMGTALFIRDAATTPTMEVEYDLGDAP